VTCRPTGSVPANRSSATVWPITTTRRPAVLSSLVKAAPVSTGVFEAAN
jgi:hypothetical protein